MRTPAGNRVGRYERYRRTRSVGALEPPSYEESEEASAQSVSNLETPLPNYEEALLRSTSLHDLLHQDDLPRVPLPTIPVDWDRPGPSGVENGGRHLSSTSTEPDDTLGAKLCYSCCCVALILIIFSIYMSMAFYLVNPQNIKNAWIIFSVMFFIPMVICTYPSVIPGKREENE